MFTQPCFIRKFSMNLIDELKKIGMSHKQCIVSKHVPYIFVNRGFYSQNDFGSKEEIEKAIDCGTNEDLFLAIAALNDNGNYMQWFTNGKNWYQNKINDIEIIRFGAGDPIDYHKATIKELIEYFK